MLIARVFWAQVDSPTAGDWCLVVREDLQQLGLDHLTYASIAEMSKDQLKNLLKKQVEETALEYLNNEKEKLSKLRPQSYPALKMQPYLSNVSQLPVRLKQVYFKWRTRMIKVGWNFGSKTKCPLCSEVDDNQNHLFDCPNLTDNIDALTTNLIIDNQDSNIDNSDWDSIYKTLKRLEKAIRKRDVLLEEQET